MEDLSPKALKLIAGRFKLLANPTRLAILQHICTQERSVSELIDLTGFRQANISSQLGLLLRGGMVKRRSEGGRVHYQIADPALPQICEAMQQSIRAHQDAIRADLEGG